METVDISALDTRYEGHRLKDKRRERLLYMSILENGVQEPLYVIEEQVQQASLVEELHIQHGLSVSEIASRLERSHAWVSLRLGIWKEMGREVREKIMAGHFPLHNYLYTLKRFKRLKTVSQKSLESFVRTVSNKGLSTRDIDMLAQGYFEGGESLQQQIVHGNIDWTLRQLKKA